MRADTRIFSDPRPDAPAAVPAEALRDQVFAACGYALPIAAAVTGLLAQDLGRLGLAAFVVLIALLVPVNVLGIRRFARIRHSLTARHPATPAERRDPAVARQRASQR